MKKSICILLLALVVISGIVLAKRQNENKNTEKATSKALATAATTTAFQNWEATPEAIDFRKWQNSSEGKNVLAAAASIAKHVKDSSAMHAIVTSLTLPPGSRLGYGILVSINSNSYILSFGALRPDEFQHLRSLSVNDTITIKSKYISYAPKYAYPILSGNYVELNNKVIFTKPYNKNGC
ncbi:MAG: hypothetical protein ACK5WV_09335 [Chryseotalea sp.]